MSSNAPGPPDQDETDGQQARNAAENRCPYGDCRQDFPTQRELDEHLVDVREDPDHY